MSINQIPLDYVTASQGQIYFDGILIDEIYDIQYTYREFKEPIYGYNSKYYDHLLEGTVIIHGQFSINYKHDSYLVSIFDKIQQETTNYDTGSANTVAIIQKKNDKLAEDYRTTLQSIKDNIAKKKELEAKIKNATVAKQTLEASKDLVQNGNTNMSNALSNSISKADMAVVDHLAKVESNSPTDYIKLRQDIGKYEVNQASVVLTDAQRNEDVTYYTEIVNSLTNQIANIQKDVDAQTITINNLGTTGAIIPQALYDALNIKAKELSDLQARLVIAKDQLAEVISISSGDVDQANKKANKALSSSDGMKYLKLKLQLDLAAQKKNLFDNVSGNALIDSASALQKAQDLITSLNAELKIVTEAITQGQKKATSNKADASEIGNKMLEAIKEVKNANDYAVADRAEDTLAFNIFFNYNGLTHKILKDCTLTGHTHAVQQGGEAIREYYSFIAKGIV